MTDDPVMMSSANPTYVYQFVAMRVLILIIATIAAAHQIVAAQTLSHPVVARPGGGMPANKMQIETRSSQYDVPPKFISGPAPIYPPSRLRNRESGYADIVFAVDETGHTRDFRVLKTSYLYFANHAILAVQNWRYQPATKNGRPVSCRIHVPFDYRCTPPFGSSMSSPKITR
jgi:TonB family protein